MLVREADHRIKNSLQLVISLLNVQLRGITDPAAVEALRGAATRVGAIAASHLALQGSADLTTIDLAVSLQDLCAHFAALHPTVKIVCQAADCQAAVCQAAECQAAECQAGLCQGGGPLLLDADRAIPLGPVVSEVLTDALRHAFRGRETGTVVVNAMIERAQLMVRISDDGVGMAPAMRRSGLGSRIINALAAQLAATIQVESPLEGGTVVTLRLPLAPADPPQRAADLMD